MKKYMFIFHVSGPVDMSGDMGESTHKWFDGLGDSLVDGGNPFNPESEASVSQTGVEKDSDTAGGYCIVSAENLDAAIALAKDCPLATMPGGAVKIYETMPM